MRGVLVDGLVVVAHHLGFGEGHVLPVHALALQAGLIGGLVVGPVKNHTGLAGVDGAVGHVHLGQVAGVLELLEEVQAGLQVVQVAALERVDHHESVERGTSLGRLAVQSHSASELRVEQVVNRFDLTVLVLVPANGHNAGIVAVVQAVRILELIRNLVPGLHLVGCEVIGVGGGHSQTGVEHIRGGVGAGVGLGGIDLLLGGGVRVELGDFDLRILLLEGLDDLAPVGPVVRQSDDVQRALFLGGGLKILEGAEVGDGGGGGPLLVGVGSLSGVVAAGRVGGTAGGHGHQHGGGECAGRDLTQGIHLRSFPR